MRNIPIVSIMMTAYNQEDYISEAIESILIQKTKYTFELVIGEDCSQDKTLQICLEYQTKFPEVIRVIQNFKNLGILGNWDSTFANCVGQYLALCEGDNYWTDPYKLEKLISFLENNNDIGLICTNYSKFYQTDKFREYNCLNNRNFQKFVRYEDYIIERNSIMSASVLMRRVIYHDYLKIVPSDIRYKWQRVPDTPLFLYFTYASKVSVLDDSTAEYRILDVSGCRLGDDYLQYDYILKGFDIPLYFSETLFPNEILGRKVKMARLNYALDFWFSKSDLKELIKIYSELGKALNISSLRYYIYYISLKFKYLNYFSRLLISKWRLFRLKYLRL